MNNKVKLAIAVAVGIVGGGIISSLGGGSEEPKNFLLGSKCGTVGRTGTDQPVAVCEKCVNWVDLDEFLVENPNFNTNMFLQTLEGYGPGEE
jgi:hypothetical protein